MKILEKRKEKRRKEESEGQGRELGNPGKNVMQEEM